jgi:hypothetical protein
MSSPEIPQDVALKLQLAAIRGLEPKESFFELRPFGSKMEPAAKDRVFLPVRDTREAMDRIAEHARRLNCYVGAAPRVRQRGTADAIERVWCLWADCDRRNALERLSDFRPLPGIIVRSGSDESVHAYWPLREPLPPGWAKRANRRLALALGADPASTDPARILRPVGSLNHKHNPPRPVRCTRLEVEVFSWAEVAGSLPDDRDYLEPPRPGGKRQPVGSPTRQLEGLVRTVAEAKRGNRNNSLHWAACCVREGVEEKRLDLGVARSELRAAALCAGLPELEIEQAIASGLRGAWR